MNKHNRRTRKRRSQNRSFSRNRSGKIIHVSIRSHSRLSDTKSNSIRVRSLPIEKDIVSSRKTTSLEISSYCQVG